MESAKEHLEKYCESHGWGTSDADLLEALQEENTIYREERRQYRWWNEYRYVVEIDGMKIGYIYAEANRDESVNELGYEFDPFTICEMKPIEKTIITYQKVCTE